MCGWGHLLCARSRIYILAWSQGLDPSPWEPSTPGDKSPQQICLDVFLAHKKPECAHSPSKNLSSEGFKIPVSRYGISLRTCFVGRNNTTWLGRWFNVWTLRNQISRVPQHAFCRQGSIIPDGRKCAGSLVDNALVVQSSPRRHMIIKHAPILHDQPLILTSLLPILLF